MSHTVASQHPAVVLRSNYQHLRALLAIAVILGLTAAIVVLATNNTSGPARPTTLSARITQPSVTNYPDAVQPSVSTPQPSVTNYPDAAQPSVSTPQPTVTNYPDAAQPRVSTPQTTVTAPQTTVTNYPDAAQPRVSTPQTTVISYSDAPGR